MNFTLLDTNNLTWDSFLTTLGDALHVGLYEYLTNPYLRTLLILGVMAFVSTWLTGDTRKWADYEAPFDFEYEQRQAAKKHHKSTS